VLWLRHYEWISTENQHFYSNGVSLTQNFRQKGSPPSTILCVDKTRMNVLSCGTKIRAKLSFILSQSTRLKDRQTDRIMTTIACSNTVRFSLNTEYVASVCVFLQVDACTSVCDNIHVYRVTKVSSVSMALHSQPGLEAAASLFQLYLYLEWCFPDLTKQPSITHKLHI